MSRFVSSKRAKSILPITLILLASIISAFPQQPKEKGSGSPTESFLLSVDDILDWPGFCAKLRKEGSKELPSPSRRIWELLPKEIKTLVQNAPPELSATGKQQMVDALNAILKNRDLFQEEKDDFMFTSTGESKSRLVLYRRTLPDMEIERLNRLLLEGSYPEEIAKSKPPLGRKTLEEFGEIKERHDREILGIPGVVSFGVKMTETGYAFFIGVEEESVIPLVPKFIEDIPVEVKVTGKFQLYQETSCNPPPAPCENRLRYSYPVPMGTSTGNSEACNVGTLGFKACESADIVGYVTANHVATMDSSECVNRNPIGTRQYHRGRAETWAACNYESEIGTLRRFEPLQPDPSTNRVDAAFILSRDDYISNTILKIGASTTQPRRQADLVVNELVRKSGRTTGLTDGRIDSPSYFGTVNIFWCSILYRYFNQILIAPSTFADRGDSGALVVDRNKNPVGIVIGGNASLVVVSPIEEVLRLLNVYLTSVLS